MKQLNHTQKSRLPRGIASKSPVVMRLSPDEKAELEALSARESRSASSMARLVYLQGIKSFREE